MAALTFWASIASILGLGAAVWAAIKARGAQIAAKEAGAAIASRMTSATLMRLQFEIDYVVNSVDNQEWYVVARFADRLINELAPIAQRSVQGIPDELGQLLTQASEALQRLSHEAHRYDRENTEVEFGDLTARADNAMNAKRWIARAAGILWREEKVRAT